MTPGGWLLIVTGVGVVVFIVGHALWWPLRRCPRCNGTGRGKGSTPKAYNKRCGRCEGTGEVMRPLSRTLNKVFGAPIRAQRKGK
jgi:DnaJ-class molecular chaperone